MAKKIKKRVKVKRRSKPVKHTKHAKKTRQVKHAKQMKKCGRNPSRKGKDSKIRKLIKLAKKKLG